MNLQEQTIISGRYRLLKKIGMGGFSQVWKAEDLMAENATLSLKIYAPELGMDDIGLKQFRREYRVVLDLNYAGLLAARHFDVWEGRPYLVMPYIRGGSLAQRLAVQGRLSETEIAGVLHQVASSLAYLHRKKVLHQDLKPDNILIGDDDTYLLTDFGISSRLRSTLRKSTVSPSFMTVAYAPPERFEALPEQLPAGDIFSLGVMAYEMATGDVPWMGNGGMALIKGAEIPRLTNLYSKDLSDLLSAMMALKPGDRPNALQVALQAGKFLETGYWSDAPDTGSKARSDKSKPGQRVTEKWKTPKPGKSDDHEVDLLLSSDDESHIYLKRFVVTLATGLILVLLFVFLLLKWYDKPSDPVAIWPEDTETEVVEVTNPITGRVWMDRNLGASRAAISPSDSLAFGDLYQWGRAADGHQKRSSESTFLRSTSTQPRHTDFIRVTGSPFSWRPADDNSLWQGLNGLNNPCPAGFRLPTQPEWEAELQSWSSTNSAGAFGSALKLPMAKGRGSTSGIVITGNLGGYWSASALGSNSRMLYFNTDTAYLFTDGQARGNSVRCIKH